MHEMTGFTGKQWVAFVIGFIVLRWALNKFFPASA